MTMRPRTTSSGPSLVLLMVLLCCGLPLQARPNSVTPAVRQAVERELARIRDAPDLATGLDAVGRVRALARSTPEAGRLFRAKLARLARRGEPQLKLLRGLTLLEQRPTSKRGQRYVKQAAAAPGACAQAGLLAQLLAPLPQAASGRTRRRGWGASDRWDAHPLWSQLSAEGNHGLVQPAMGLLAHLSYRHRDPRAVSLVEQASRGFSWGLSGPTKQAVLQAMVSCAVSPGAGKLRQDVFAFLGRNLAQDKAEIALGPGTMAANLGQQAGAFSYLLWPNLRWVSRSDLDLSSFGRAFTRVAGRVGRIHFDVTDHLGDEGRFRQQMTRACSTRFSRIHDGREDAPYVTSKELHLVLTNDTLLDKTTLYRRDHKGRFHPLPPKQVQRLARLAREQSP